MHEDLDKETSCGAGDTSNENSSYYGAIDDFCGSAVEW